MDAFNRRELNRLLESNPAPCASWFLPTNRGGSEEDPIRWKNALTEVKQRFQAADVSPERAEELLFPAQALLKNAEFWKHLGDGLAAFLAADGRFQFFRLPISFRERVVVASQYCVSPLTPLLQDRDFYVLALSANRVRLLHGSRGSIDEVEIGGLPKDEAEALIRHDRDEVLNVHSQPALHPGRQGAIFHGHGVGKDTAKDDLRLYFRQIDRALHNRLRDERAPLVLAAVESLWPLYRLENKYPHLLETGIAGSPDRLSDQEIHDRGWAIVAPMLQATRSKALDAFAQLAGTGRTIADLQGIVPAARQGGIDTLFVVPEAECWGTINPTTGRASVHPAMQRGDEDLVNDAVIHTLRHHGAVHPVEPNDLPKRSVCAAICRMPAAAAMH